MNTKIMANLSAFELRLFSRNFIGMFFLLAFPVMMLLLFGFMFSNDPAEQFGGYGTVDVSVPGYAGMVISITALMSLPQNLSEYREKRILKRYKATPIEPAYVIVSQVLANLIMTIIGMLLLIAAAVVIFGLEFQGNVGNVVIVFVYSTFCIYALGFLIASLAPNMKAATAIANLVYFPMLFMTGATIPSEILPDVVQNIALVLPVTHVVEAMKAVWFGGSIASVWPNMLVLTGFLVVCSVLSVIFFRWE